MAKRKQTKIYASKKQIVDIREFMELYIDKAYTWNETLTHKKMTEFLREKNRRVPDRVCYDLINKEDLLNGTYIIVKDEVGQTIIYENPRNSLGFIQNDLNRKYDEVEMKKRREFALSSFYSDLGVTEDEYFNKSVDQKVKNLINK